MAQCLQRPRIAVLCVVAALLAGCLFSNTKYTNIGNVEAQAYIHEDNVPSYYEITIRQPLDPSAPRLLLKLPTGKVIDRRSFNYDALLKAGLLSDPKQDYQPDKDYSHLLSRWGLYFFFSNGELIRFRMMKSTGTLVGIGREGSKQFYTLPMTDKELEALFGHPDDSSTGFRLQK
jgi:hypothetical protein